MFRQTMKLFIFICALFIVGLSLGFSPSAKAQVSEISFKKSPNTKVRVETRGGRVHFSTCESGSCRSLGNQSGYQREQLSQRYSQLRKKVWANRLLIIPGLGLCGLALGAGYGYFEVAELLDTSAQMAATGMANISLAPMHIPFDMLRGMQAGNEIAPVIGPLVGAEAGLAVGTVSASTALATGVAGFSLGLMGGVVSTMVVVMDAAFGMVGGVASGLLYTKLKRSYNKPSKALKPALAESETESDTVPEEITELTVRGTAEKFIGNLEVALEPIENP